ncbi:MAG TPA: rhodanese-like domain-containing protein [Psychromonas sp.]
MFNNIKKTATFIALLLLPLSLMATEIVGKIQSISQQAKVIQYLNTKTNTVEIITFSEQTKLENATSFNDLTVNTKFKATVNDKMAASYIKRILVQLPEEQVITTEPLFAMIENGHPLFIGDARPTGIYNMGHLPNAISTPATELADKLQLLPEDKTTPLVFYCGGVTCPLSPKAMKIAMSNGYTNVKAYVEGFPAWKEEVYPVHVNQNWLAQNLDTHHIILDVRDTPTNFIQGALHLPASKLLTMHEQWNKDKYPTSKRTFLGLRDKKAPISIVADTETSTQAIEAYEILTFWTFKNVAILNGGMDSWLHAKLPLGDGKIGTELVYVKKLSAGEITEADFVKAVKSGSATIIDLRDSGEVSQGRLQKSINIPLEQLAQNLHKIPKTGLVILHCSGGSRAALAYTLLSKKGYKNVKYLSDSFADIAQKNGLKLI